MIRIIKEIDVEVSKPNLFQAIVAKQYDSGSRYLKATFKNEGQKIFVPITATTVISAERTDGKSDSFSGETNADGTVTVPLHSWMLELEGTVNCDISIIDTQSDIKLTSTTFTLAVEKAANGGADISDDPQYDVLISLIQRVEEVEAGNGLFANAIKGTASNVKDGVVSNDGVYITDISPLEHNINVKVDNADTKVIRSGKNLLNGSFWAAEITSGSLSIQYLPDEDCYLINGINDQGKNLALGLTRINVVGENTKYTVSVKPVGGTVIKGESLAPRICFAKDNDTVNPYTNWLDGFFDNVDTEQVSKPLDEKYIGVAYFYIYNGNDFKNYKIKIQLEKGDIATEYGKYVAPTEHTPNADGTLIVPSVYPTTILTTNTEGVTIEAEYNRDINKAFAELTKAIISLGGNV